MHDGAGADLEQEQLARDRLGTVDHQVVEPEALDECCQRGRVTPGEARVEGRMKASSSARLAALSAMPALR